MNKLNTLFSIIAIAFPFLASAQDVFIVEKNNGDKLEFNVENIKQMYFKDVSESTGNLAPEGVKIVDLGLSVAWASCNVGATKPEATGTFVQWGATSPISWYSWSYYPFGNAQNINKYTNSDGNLTLQSVDDYASKTWGSDWHTPTMAELQELVENCDIEYNAMENGVQGVRFTSKVAGYTDKSIFIPATGYRQDNIVINPNDAYIWSSSVAQGFYQFAISLFACNSDEYAGKSFITGNYRYIGMNIRPVTKVPEKKKEEDVVDLGLSVKWGTTNIGAQAPEDAGIYVAWGETAAKDTYDWKSYTLGSSSVSQSKYSKTDKLEVLEADDDIVTKTKGDTWRMPTNSEIEELLTNCKTEIIQINGVNCIQFTSKVDGFAGAKIVFPLGGYRENSSITNDKSSFAIWSSSVAASGFRSSAWGLEGNALSNPTVKSASRYIGRNVRGVQVKSKE